MSDSHIVEQARRGQAEAFETLVYRYGPVLMGLYHGRVDDAAAREDLVQEVFLAAFERLPQLKNPSRFRPWLIRIAKAKLADYYRKKSRERRHFVSPAEQYSEPPEAPDPAWGPRERSVEDETLESLKDAMARLSASQRIVVYLKLWEGLSNEEIVERTGLEYGAVRVRLHRAMRSLRKDLKRRGVTIAAEMMDGYQET